jgi:purine nucleosidase
MKLEKNTKFLLDTDIGSDVDDAFALLTLLKLVPERLIGVTTAYGCAELRAKITKKLIEAAGYDIPVVAGESSPIGSPQPIHLTGKEGFGVLTKEEIEKPIESFGIETNAPEFIVKQVTNYPGEVILKRLSSPLALEITL